MGKREERLQEKLANMTVYEKKHWDAGQTLIAGIDEAGRGPLAGPVVAACVIMPPEHLILGVDDSKKLSEKRREALYAQIMEYAVAVSVCVIDEKEIDRINILQAAKKAFETALGTLSVQPLHVYTDAMALETDLPFTSLVKGDEKVYTIAAASIVAKVTRDRLMAEYDQIYPQYGFARHKGYGTKEHYEAIRRYGVLPIHRQTFLRKFF